MSRCLRELFFDPSPSFVGKRQRLDSIGSRMAGSQLRHIVLRVICMARASKARCISAW
jgi:hypothetical protein